MNAPAALPRAAMGAPFGRTRASSPMSAALTLALQRLHKDGENTLDWHVEALHEYRRSWKSSDGSDPGAEYWRIRMRNGATGAKWIRPMICECGEYRLGEPKYEKGKKPLYGVWHLEKYPTESVTVVEGEWCVDQFEFWAGNCAVTSGSASSADDCDWAPLAGKIVVLWPDKDNPGSAYMDRVADILWRLGCRLIRIKVEEVKDIPEKGDCVDFFDAIARRAGRWTHDAVKEAIRKLPTVRNG